MLDVRRKHKETSVAEVAWESRAGQGQALKGSMLCCACFTRQPYVHLGHAWASYEKAASFEMQGTSPGQSGMFLRASSILAAQPQPTRLEFSLLQSYKPDICCDESSATKGLPASTFHLYPLHWVSLLPSVVHKPGVKLQASLA